jgi:hypothetical protein
MGKRMLRIVFLTLLVVSGTASGQVSDELLAMRTRDYAQALYRMIEGNWVRPESVGTDGVCPVMIRQLPGGEVIAVNVLPECSYDEGGKQSVIQAVTRASPLPYQGFENVFRREIRLVFKAGDFRERQAQRERRLAQVGEDMQITERSRHKAFNAMNSSRWGGYVDRCIRHIESEKLARDVPRPTQRQRTVRLTIDAYGNIQDVRLVGRAGQGDELDDQRFIRAAKSISPCDPFTEDLKADTDTIDVLREITLKPA